jgi:hypothetical protein
VDASDIAAGIDGILDRGSRAEVLALLALLAGRLALAQERVRELRATEAAPRTMTVPEAVRRYPLSRSFLYERGESLGIARRVEGARKLVVDEAALRLYLRGRRG